MTIHLMEMNCFNEKMSFGVEQDCEKGRKTGKNSPSSRDIEPKNGVEWVELILNPIINRELLVYLYSTFALPTLPHLPQSRPGRLKVEQR